jgi:predicted DNA-binding transcriptional regulator AlpA
MTKISASKAAKMTGVSTPTITRAIERNDISADKKPKGGYLIEQSEIIRWMDNRNANSNATPETLGDATPIENSVLQARLELMEQRFSDAEKTIEDLRSRLDAEGTERRQLTAVLTDQREKPVEAPRERLTFMERLTGRTSS